jgi:dTDP-4-dehydrorhamnose 3,5-epimerase-like enzyme
MNQVKQTPATTAVLHELPLVGERGWLSYAETGAHIPFAVKRYFVVFGVPPGKTRGDHAHKHQHQFLVSVHGSCRLTADNGSGRQEFLLDSPAKAVHLPPMVWVSAHDFSPDAVLLVLSSDLYDPSDFLSDYTAFQELSRKNS